MLNDCDSYKKYKLSVRATMVVLKTNPFCWDLMRWEQEYTSKGFD